MQSSPRNQILYGPPGTGKTYHTAQLAVEICDGTAPEGRAQLMQRYRQLVDEGRIHFVCFHQSYSYEDFIEGIRPELTPRDDSDQEQLIYQVEDGIFKRICNLAKTAIEDLKRPGTMIDNLAGRRFYKMSVGGKYFPDVETFCLNQGYLALGWGGDVDYSNLSSGANWDTASKAIRRLLAANESPQKDKRYAVQAMYWFRLVMAPGDIILVPKGVSQLQAIGEVTGDYEYRPDLLSGTGYCHFRKVRWLIRDAEIPVEKVLTKNFSHMSLYSLNPAILKMEYLEYLLGRPRTNIQSSPERYVLIIDEINRANISKVLGELITLLEPDKRLGRENAVTVQLPYSRERFGVPDNLFIVGTMNTADRSLALLDTALRRRFHFREMMPDYTVLNDLQVDGIKIDKLLQTINSRIEVLYDREHSLGHGFFIPLMKTPTLEQLADIFETNIIPLLMEYFFEDWGKIRLVLGDTWKTAHPEHQFILEEEPIELEKIFGASENFRDLGFDQRKQYRLNHTALTESESYIGIYDPTISSDGA